MRVKIGILIIAARCSTSGDKMHPLLLSILCLSSVVGTLTNSLFLQMQCRHVVRIIVYSPWHAGAAIVATYVAI